MVISIGRVKTVLPDVMIITIMDIIPKFMEIFYVLLI